jgi:hypothetical protein
MGITIVNKTITPINVVVLQLIITAPVGYGYHMNIAPGESVDLDIGEVTIKQFKVYTWCGGSPETEISEDKIRAFVAGRLGLSAVTFGHHEVAHAFLENTVADVCQELVLNHLAPVIITSYAFEHALAHLVKKGLKDLVKGCITPKEFGVCKAYFRSAVDMNVRYVYGGPIIRDGTIIPSGENLYMRSEDNGYDPVTELRKLAGEEEDDVEKLVKGLVFIGAAIYLGWKNRKR